MLHLVPQNSFVLVADSIVVFHPIDAFTLAILFAMKLCAFGFGYFTIRFGVQSIGFDFSFLPLQPDGFAIGQLTALDAFFDARLLVLLSLIDYRRLILR